MIIHKTTKSVETLSSKPNENFGNYENVFVVDDTSDLGQRILENSPYFDFVLDSIGNLIDIVPIVKPLETPLPPSEIEMLRLEQTQQNEDLISQITDLQKQLNILPPITNPISLQDYQQNKIYELKINCNQHILSGFYSSYRGENSFYSFSELDQTNIMGYISMLNSDPTIPIIWKSADETLCTPFTVEQMIKLAKDGLIHKQENIYKFELLRNKVMDTNSIEGVELITWENII